MLRRCAVAASEHLGRADIAALLRDLPPPSSTANLEVVISALNGLISDLAADERRGTGLAAMLMVVGAALGGADGGGWVAARRVAEFAVGLGVNTPDVAVAATANDPALISLN